MTGANFFFFFCLPVSAEKEVVRSIKEAVCYVAFDPAKEEELLEVFSSPK
jgi:hypothetical protein